MAEVLLPQPGGFGQSAQAPFSFKHQDSTHEAVQRDRADHLRAVSRHWACLPVGGPSCGEGCPLHWRDSARLSVTRANSPDLYVLLRHRLLPQPGGFEGPQTIQVAKFPDGLGASDGPEVVDHRFHRHSATAPLGKEPGGDEDVVAFSCDIVCASISREPPAAAIQWRAGRPKRYLRDPALRLSRQPLPPGPRPASHAPSRFPP